jgi:2-C-methyl-D-erythritol 4-phosphate cytidylyltransferase
VLAGLRAVSARGGAPEDWVLVHDAARPCLGADELTDLLAALGTPIGAANGALLALPVADTVKRGEPLSSAAATAVPGGASVTATVPRDGLWRALTPQAFRLGPLTTALENALQRAVEPGGAAPTDEAAAMEALGVAPVLVPGSPYNVKVTVPADLAFAATVLRSWKESSRG